MGPELEAKLSDLEAALVMPPTCKVHPQTLYNMAQVLKGHPPQEAQSDDPRPVKSEGDFLVILKL